jgi:hypothetical protein
MSARIFPSTEIALTNTNTNGVCSIGIDGDKVTSNNGHVVVVDCENEDALGRSVYQSQQVPYTLRAKVSNVGDAQLPSIHNTLLNVMLYRDGGFSSQSPAAVSFGVQLYCPISVSVLSIVGKVATPANAIE